MCCVTCCDATFVDVATDGGDGSGRRLPAASERLCRRLQWPQGHCFEALLQFGVIAIHACVAVAGNAAADIAATISAADDDAVDRRWLAGRPPPPTAWPVHQLAIACLLQSSQAPADK